MLRNREIQIFLLLMSTFSLVFVLAGVIFSYEAGILQLISSLILLGCSLAFTNWRYRELEKLSAYLRKISGGDYSLDVRDNQEGELSILKNEIFKVTRLQSERTNYLLQDKKEHMDAISDISHQLKTPLTSMKMMTDLLQDANLPEDKRMEFTYKIRIQLERIEWLVSSLLKLSKIDAGTVYFKKELVLVKELIEKAMDAVMIPMDIKAQAVTVNGDDTVSFLGDFNWTAEAVINILKNCVEHTPHGGALNISFLENVLYTEIVITDNGIGIAKDDLPYIFQRFYKGKNAHEGSIGIGLAMSHSIISNQQGDIEVESTETAGTTFRIKFYKQ